MRLRRVIWFVFTILIGLGAGLLYGWVFSPARYQNTSPVSLRADYKADYVLMVAETYQSEGDPAAAAERLAALEKTSPVRQVQQAILTGQQVGYSHQDIDRLGQLFQALQNWTATPGLTPTSEVTPTP